MGWGEMTTTPDEVGATAQKIFDVLMTDVKIREIHQGRLRSICWKAAEEVCTTTRERA